MARFVFGPVPSRRLGFSLGVDIIPQKVCTFDCIYCQIGKTTRKELTRESFFNPQEIINEVMDKLREIPYVDFITFSGSGEPTLNADIGLLIKELKHAAAKPIAVITNGSLLYLEEVRRDIILADAILPSLDAASEDIYRYINRPHGMLKLHMIIDGIKKLRREYSGQIWLEIMLIKKVNDDPDELKKFREIIETLHVDKVQLNTVTRPPSEEIREVYSIDELEKICDFFGEKCEIISSFEKHVEGMVPDQWPAMIREILERRSLSLDDIIKLTGTPFGDARKKLARMEKDGELKSYHFGNDIFYMKK